MVEDLFQEVGWKPVEQIERGGAKEHSRQQLAKYGGLPQAGGKVPPHLGRNQDNSQRCKELEDGGHLSLYSIASAGCHQIVLVQYI